MPGILLPLPPQTDRKMKKRITEQDYLKAHRKASREEEIARPSGGTEPGTPLEKSLRP